jgi:hypothetical protein
LAKSYKFLYARTVDVIVDRSLLQWGDDWSQTIEQAVNETDFLLAFVTPLYLNSDSCRREIERFDATHSAPDDKGLILPLIWQPIDGVVPDGDPVKELILRHQYVNASALRDMDPTGVEYRQETERLAERLYDAITRREALTPDNTTGMTLPAPPLDAADDDEPDAFDLMAKVTDLQGCLEQDFSAFQAALEGLGGSLDAINPDRLSGPRAQAELHTAAIRTGPFAESLIKASSAMGLHWNELLDATRLLVDLMAAAESSDQSTITSTMSEALGSIIQQLHIPGQEATTRKMTQLGRLSKHLRPSVRAVASAFKAIDTIRDSAEVWLDQLNKT